MERTQPRRRYPHLSTRLRLNTGLVLACLALNVVACHAPVTVVTAKGKAAYSADQVARRVGELELATIDAAQQGTVTLALARQIVQWCVDAETVLQTVPEGWYLPVSQGYSLLKLHLQGSALDKLRPYFDVLDAVLSALAPQAPGLTSVGPGADRALSRRD